MMNKNLLFVAILIFVIPAATGFATGSTLTDDKDRQDARVWLADIGHEDLERKKAAIEALEQMGPKAKSLVPELIAILEKNDPHTNRESIYILGTIGREARAAVPALTKALYNDDFHVQYWACRSLGKMKEDAKPAVPALIQLMANGAASPRRNAAMALGNIGPTVGQEAVQGLIRSLDDQQHEVRVQAAEALGKLAEAAQPALQRLDELLENPNYTARLYAATSHWILTGASEKALGVILFELQSHNRPWDAAAAFERLGVRGRLAVPQLVKFVESPNNETQLYAVEALGHIGPAAKMVVPILEKIAHDEQAPEDLRETCKDALKKINGPEIDPKKEVEPPLRGETQKNPK